MLNRLLVILIIWPFFLPPAFCACKLARMFPVSDQHQDHEDAAHQQRVLNDECHCHSQQGDQYYLENEPHQFINILTGDTHSDHHQDHQLPVCSIHPGWAFIRMGIPFFDCSQFQTADGTLTCFSLTRPGSQEGHFFTWLGHEGIVWSSEPIFLLYRDLRC